MKYTKSKEADKKIAEDMKIICEEALREVKGVESIMLTGGFSRGEGPVKIEEGKVYPYNDYDIQIVSKEKISKEETDRISIAISEKAGYKGIANFYPFKKEEQKMKGNFYIDLKIDTLQAMRKMLPRIRTYELRNNSLILYGKDLRQFIPDYKLEELPLSEGAKLLLDRMSQMIEYYSVYDKYDKEFLAYIIQQAYAACCTALLTLDKKYEIGYLTAMSKFKAVYKKDFPELYEKLPKLAEKIEEFILWKANPKKPQFKDIKKEWFLARENILEVSKYFFSRFLNKKINTNEELAKGILNMKKEFYVPYIKSMREQKIRGMDWIDEVAGYLFVPLFFRHKYNQRLKELGVKYNSKVFSPDLTIFSSLVYFISSIDEGDKIDYELLNKGRKLLRNVFPSNGKDWEETSLDYANAYIAFFLQKI